MKYRNSVSITNTILECTQQVGRTGLKVTEIMTKANVPYPRLTGFLKKLTSNGLINKIEVRGKHTFIITEKGILYLAEYKKFQDLAESFGMEL